MKKTARFIAIGVSLLICICGFWASRARAENVTSTVTISICGNAVAEGSEVCDDGVNSGAYSQTISGRSCNTECNGWGPYCGDRILQPSYFEECDDQNNVSADGCTDVCKMEPTPTTGGGGGSGPYVGGASSPSNPTRLAVKGKGYPNSDVHILKDGNVIGVVKADSKADFSFSTTDVTPGIATFGFWAEDSKQIRSVSFTITLQVVANAVTTISGVFLPPTITMDKRSVKKGESIKFSGTTVPVVEVSAHVNSEETVITKTRSTDGGAWTMNFDTSPLKDEDFHTAKAMFKVSEGDATIQSGFSQALSFYVGSRGSGKFLTADINRDGKVNLVDFSILLFYWGKTHDRADINSDNKINLTDFSIMLYQWTG